MPTDTHTHTQSVNNNNNNNREDNAAVCCMDDTVTTLLHCFTASFLDSILLVQLLFLSLSCATGWTGRGGWKTADGAGYLVARRQQVTYFLLLRNFIADWLAVQDTCESKLLSTDI